MAEIINPAKVEIELDCGNTHMTNEEELWLKERITEVIESRNIAVKNIKVWR